MILLITVSVILIVGYFLDKKRKKKIGERYRPFIYPHQAAAVLREAGIFVVDNEVYGDGPWSSSPSD